MTKPVELSGYMEGTALGFINRLNILAKEIDTLQAQLSQAVAALMGWPIADWPHYRVVIIDNKVFFYDSREYAATQDGQFVEVINEAPADSDGDGAASA